MILSMTGYGEVQHAEGDVSYGLELRSLNNRYLKISVKLPEHLSVLEGEVEKLLRSRITRGTVTYNLRVSSKSAEAAQQINVAALESYLAQLRQVAAKDQSRIDLATLLTLPGVCQPPQATEAELDRQWKILADVTDKVMDHLIEMRKVEGAALREDLLSQCNQIREHLVVVEERAPGVVKEYNERLLQRVNGLIAEARLQLQLDDLKREVAIYAERCDINEELSRLRSHLDQFEKLCDSNERAGRKLDFLAQEMLREANTIGSKANDTTIAHRIVDIKGAIDRLKEQVQNVE